MQLLRREFEFAPAGLTGQIAITGPLLARGYLGQPARTAAHFRPDSGVSLPGSRRYLTRDLGSIEDGALYFRGRVDDPATVHGQHIDLLAIESALRGHIRVREAFASIADAAGRNAPIAHVVLGIEERPDLELELKDHVAGKLPAYMVPAALVFVDALPRGRDGEVDRARLPAVNARAVRTARTDTERILTTIWEEVLRTGSINVERPFFELGGNSLNLLTAARLISERMGREVTAADMLRNVSIRNLARHLDAGRAQPPASESTARRRAAARLDAIHRSAARASGGRP